MMEMERLLVVDDDPGIRDMMQLILGTYGYDTYVAARGEEVMHKVREYRPNLIILDYLLSGMDGSAICMHLKNQPDTRNIPVIMFSAHPTARNVARSSGAEGFITKPFCVDDLIHEIKKHTGVHAEETGR